MGSTKSKWENGVLTFYDSSTYEHVLPVAPVVFYDDFLGKLDLYTAADNSAGIWTPKDTSGGGSTIEALLADGLNGVLRLALDNTNEKQEAGVYFGDERNFALAQDLIFEARVALHTLPTGQAEVYFGLAGDYVEGPIAEADEGPAEHIFFCFDGSGACKIFTDDTSHDNDAVATGVTVVADAYHIFRIDCSNPASVKFYIDGVRVAASTTFNMNHVAALKLQPFFMVHKETGVGVGEAYIDYVRVFQKRA
jgi:hypothetical protein